MDRIEDYEIVRELGQGGFGTVFEARSPEGRRVAIKVLHDHLVNDTTIVQRFRQEALILARLDHPAIPKVERFGPWNGTQFLVLDFVEGRELEELIGNEPFSVPEAIGVMDQLFGALQYAHEHEIVHRDLKPANMVLTPDGTLKILDFGIAKIMGGASLTAPGIANVTLGYSPPEQLRGQPVDGRADLFAAGMLFHQMLVGKLPFKATHKRPIEAYQAHLQWVDAPRASMRQTAPTMPAWIDEFYQRCTASSPGDRFPDAETARRLLLERGRPQSLKARINRGPARAPSTMEIDQAPATEMMDVSLEAAPTTIMPTGGPPAAHAAPTRPMPGIAPVQPEAPAPTAAPAPDRSRMVMVIGLVFLVVFVLVLVGLMSFSK